MKKLLTICVSFILLFGFGSVAFGVFGDSFISIQLGNTPVANNILTTDGTDNIWSDGITLDTVTSTNLFFSNATGTSLYATNGNFNSITTTDSLYVGGNLTVNKSASTTNLYVLDTLTAESNLVLNYLTAGSITYVGANKGLTQNNSDLYYDYTNNRVGIGTNSPTSKLEVSSGTTTTELIDVSNYRIKNVASPVDSLDAINKAYFDANFTGGVIWQDEVLNILDFTTSEPAGPTVGDRYITNATGTMSLTGQYGYSQHIYTWDTTNWATTTPVDKWGLKNVADGNLYVFNQEDWAWNSIGSSWAHSVLLDVKGSTEQYHVSFNQYSNMFVKGTDDSDDLSEGSTNLFYTNARVDTRVQGGSYTVTGDWVFNNPLTVDDPVSDLQAVNFQTLTAYMQGFTWKDPVIDKDLSTPPVSPTLGDRYIVAGNASGWYDTDWSARQDLSLSSADVSAAQTNYPVLIKLTDSGNTVFSTAQADGDDILFTDEDGTKLKHEIETYNATNEFYAWVKVPFLSSTSTSNIYMYYGNAGSGSQQEVADTWDSNYEVVYHLEEASGSADDSTGVYDGSNTSVSYSATGKIGKAYDYNGTSAYTDTNCTTDLSGTGDFTIEAWMEADSTTEIYGITQTHTFPGYSSDFIFYYNGSTNLWWMRSKQLAQPGGFTGTNWNHIVMVWDSSAETYEGFVNGVSAGTSAVVVGYGGINSIKLATRGDAISSFWDGIMDEVRISTSLRSDDYIATTYNITNDPDSFVAFGAEETIDASGDWSGHVNDLTEWDSVNWTFETPLTGWATIVLDESLQYVFNGSNWIISSGALGAHNDTTGLQGCNPAKDECYHHDAADYTEITGWLDDVVLSDGGSMDIGIGDFNTTGDIASVEDITASGIIQGEMVLANGAGSHPSGIGAYLELYILGGATARILPFDGSSYYDLAIGDWNGGDVNIMLKKGGNVGINEGSPATTLHVGGSGYFEGEANEEQLTVRGHSTQTDYTLVVEQSDGTDVFTVNNDGKATTTSNINVGGYASSTSGLYTQGNSHIGGNTTMDGTLRLDTSKGYFNVIVTDNIRNSTESETIVWSVANNRWESSAGISMANATTTDSIYIGGNANLTGLLKTSNSVVIEQQVLQNFWAFKYEDSLGAGANTGMYFNLFGSAIELQVGGSNIFSVTTGGDGAFAGDLQVGSGIGANDYTLTFDGNASDGVLTWMEDEDWFATADTWRFSKDIAVTTLYATSTLMDSASTTDSLYVGGNANFSGQMNTTNVVAIEQQVLQSFWPFKYEDSVGAGANTGMYFDATNGYVDLTWNNTTFFHAGILGLYTGLGNTGNHTLGFSAGGANEGKLKWWTDENYFEFEDSVIIDGNATTTGDFEVEGNATTTNLYASADMTVAGNVNLTGLLKTSNAVAIEQQALQSFWAFKYEDSAGVGANTGMYFDALGGSLDVKYLNNNIWSIANIATGAMKYGNALDVSMTFAPNSPQNTGVYTWMEDEDYFQFADDVVFDKSVTTTDRLYVGNQLSVATSSPWSGYEVAVFGDTVLDGDVHITGTTTLEYVWHVYGGFQAENETIDVTGAGVWATTTNAGGDLWDGLESDGFSINNDVMTFEHPGDFTGNMSISFEGGTTKDFGFRIYSITDEAIQGYYLRSSGMGNNNYVNVSIPVYFEDVTAGEQFRFETTCFTDGSDPTFHDATFYIQYLHD